MSTKIGKILLAAALFAPAISFATDSAPCQNLGFKMDYAYMKAYAADKAYGSCVAENLGRLEPVWVEPCLGEQSAANDAWAEAYDADYWYTFCVVATQQG